MSMLAILNFYNAANATMSDASYMKKELAEGDALKHFARHEEEIGSQIHRLNLAFQKMKEAAEALKISRDANA